MPVCPACAKDNPESARFCMSCGASLGVAEPGPQAARKTVTVVFCDLAGSTAMGERLDPEAVREVMTRYYRSMRGALEARGGTVEKYIGDAVMGVFGVPILHEDDALRAVQAAEAMRDSLAALNAEVGPRYDVEIATRIGVNTGEVVVGDPSAGQSLVVGDAVNVAARLEQAAPAGGILLGPQTYALVRQHVDAEPTPPLELKGKAEGVVAYRLATTSPARDAIGLRVDPPFVGRAHELEALATAFVRARTGRACVLSTVVGAAGVGKSRLSREFLGSLDPGVRVIRGRCLPYGEGITFWPVIEIVKDACAITDDEPRASARTKIEQVLAGAEDAALVAERVSAVAGFGETTAGLQETFWSIRRFLEHLARDEPLVVVFDDIHWGETALHDLVEYLAGWMHDAPVLLLCLARPELLDVRAGWGAAHADATTLPLGPLDEHESERLIGALLADDVGDAALGRIREAGGGNPLFLEELLRMLEDEGALERRDGRWAAVGDLGELRVPGTIHALLAARLDRLSAEERDVIRAAAVVGKEFWWGAVDHVAEPSLRSRVGGHLQTLVRKDLIRPERSTLVGEDAFGFHHLLIQEAAYLGTPKDVRATLHERFADWMESTAGDRLGELEALLGYHLERAYRLRTELAVVGPAEAELADRAARWLGRAGARAVERRDAGAAVDLLGRAAAVASPDAPERPAMLLDLVAELGEVGDLGAAQRRVEELETLATTTADRGLAARAAIVRLNLLESTDPKQLAASAGSVEVVLATLEALGDELWVARGWLLVGDLHMANSRYAEADRALERAIVHARRADATREEADASGRFVGSGLYGPAHVDVVERRCLDHLERTSGAAESPGYRALGAVRAMQGRFDEARAFVERARAILEDLGLRLRANWVRETSGAIEVLAGDPAAAERELREGVERAAALGDQGFEGTAAALLAHVVLDLGRTGEAEDLAARTEAVAAPDDRASQVLWRSARARAIATRSPDQAEPLARDAVALAVERDDVNLTADAFASLGEVLGVCGDRTGAASAFSEAIALLETKGNAPGADRIRARSASTNG